MKNTSNVNIRDITTLKSPASYLEELPTTPTAAETTLRAREDIGRVTAGDDDRLLLLVGPCSIHDEKSGLEYARLLAGLAEQMKDRLVIVMRVYFEKPRTTVGWKGLINDPNLNGTFDMATGLTRVVEVARRIRHGEAGRGLGHAASGPALQQNLLCILEGDA